MKAKNKTSLSEREWNKDSKTPRDYSKEYNPPGSKEQDERNKRKRDKRKHDKEEGKCSSGEELHHVDGIKGDKMECEPISKNRGRKEKSRLKKDAINIKIEENQLRKIIQEESIEVLNEMFPAVLWNMGTSALGAVGSAVGSVAKGAWWMGKKAAGLAADAVKGTYDLATGSGKQSTQRADTVMKGLPINKQEDLIAGINALIAKAKTKGLGKTDKLKKAFQGMPQAASALAESEKNLNEGEDKL